VSKAAAFLNSSFLSTTDYAGNSVGNSLGLSSFLCRVFNAVGIIGVVHRPDEADLVSLALVDVLLGISKSRRLTGDRVLW
jgi:hypothetical protein